MDPHAIRTFLSYWMLQSTTAGYHFLDPAYLTKLKFLMQKIESDDTVAGSSNSANNADSDSVFRTSVLAQGMGHVPVSEDNSQGVFDVLSSRLFESNASDLRFEESESAGQRLNNRTYHLSSFLTCSDYINHIVKCGGREIKGGMKTIMESIQEYYVPEVVCHIEAMATGPSRFDVKVLPSTYIDPASARNPNARNSETVYVQMWDQSHLAIPQNVFMSVDWLKTGMQLARTNCQALWTKALHSKMGSASIFEAAGFRHLSEFLQFYKREVWFILYLHTWATLCAGAINFQQLLSFRTMFMQAANLIACYYGHSTPFSKEQGAFAENEYYEYPSLKNDAGKDYYVSKYKNMQQLLEDLDTSGCFPFRICSKLDKSQSSDTTRSDPSDAEISAMLAKESELLSTNGIFTRTKKRYMDLADSMLKAVEEWHASSYHF